MSHLQSMRRTVAAANSGNVALAKTHLQKAAEAAPEDAAVWLWLGWFAESPVNAVQCLEMAVEDDRYRELANAGLAWARAMANFKLAEDGPVVVAPSPVIVPPQTVARAVEPLAEVIEHLAEKRLAADVAQVAAEVAQAVAAPVVAPVATDQTEIAEEVPADVESAASSDLLTTIAALALDPWTGLPAAASPTTPVHVVESPVESPVESVSEQPWATAIRPRETGFGRASLWSGLGLGAKRETQPEAEPEPEPVDSTQEIAASVTPDRAIEPIPEADAPPPFVTTMESLGSSVMFSTPAASAVDAGVLEATVTQPEVAANWTESTIEPAPFQEAIAVAEPLESETTTPALAAAPGLWRAMKSSWFSSQPVEDNKLAVEPIVAELGRESSGPATGQMPVEQPEFSVPTDRVSPTTSQRDSLFAWQRDSIEVVPQPASQAAPEIDITPAVDVFEDDELTVEVPLAQDASHAERVIETAPIAAPSIKTILVVDDSPTVRKLVAMTLEKRGFKVVSAFDGVAAIKEIAAHNPALILMDINMPRLDGYQLCKLVKKHETTRNIPVVMLSGKDGMFDRLRGRLVGCSGYITKPFVPEELVDAVDEYLAQAVSS